MAVEAHPVLMSGDGRAVALPVGEIGELCRRFHVQRLDLVGSAARGADFEPAQSDLDFVVTFDAAPEAGSFGHFVALREGLAAAAGRPVDLIEAGSVSNPYIRAAMERDAVRVYGS